MPVHRGSDSKGAYYQWGSQTKYHYTAGNEASRKKAKQKAHVQGAAARRRADHLRGGYRGM